MNQLPSRSFMLVTLKKSMLSHKIKGLIVHWSVIVLVKKAQTPPDVIQIFYIVCGVMKNVNSFLLEKKAFKALILRNIATIY